MDRENNGLLEYIPQKQYWTTCVSQCPISSMTAKFFLSLLQYIYIRIEYMYIRLAVVWGLQFYTLRLQFYTFN